MKFGNEVKVNCNNCGKLDKKHINRISAIVDNRIVVAGFLVGLSLLIVLGGYSFLSQKHLAFWKYLVFAGGTLAGIPVFLWNRENRAVGNFNRYSIRRD